MTMDGSIMKISPRRRLLLQSLIVVEMILLTASAFRWGLCTTITTTTADNDVYNDNSRWCPSFLVPRRQVVELLLKQTSEPFHDDEAETKKTTSRRKRLQRHRLKLVLQLEDGTLLPPSQQQQQHQHHRTLYQQWSNAWNEWMEQTSFSKWPFWKESPTSTIILGGTLTKMAKTKQSHENFETRLVATSLVEELFQSYMHRLDDDELEIILYIYSQQQQQHHQSQSSMLLFTDENTGKESEALVIQQNRLIILQGPDTSTIGNSMSYLIPFLSKITLALDDHDHGGGSIMNNSTQIEAWQQHVAKSYLQELQLELLSTREWLVQSSISDNIHIPARIGEQWMQAFISHNEAIQLYQQQQQRLRRPAAAAAAAAAGGEPKEQWREILELIEHAQLQLSQLRTDPALMPPLHFQMDHTLAIFAPLLFPLLLPMIVGLRREYKRYKTGTFP